MSKFSSVAKWVLIIIVVVPALAGDGYLAYNYFQGWKQGQINTGMQSVIFQIAQQVKAKGALEIPGIQIGPTQTMTVVCTEKQTEPKK